MLKMKKTMLVIIKLACVCLVVRPEFTNAKPGLPDIQPSNYRVNSLKNANFLMDTSPEAVSRISQIDMTITNTADKYSFDDVVECNWDDQVLPSGQTPKFHCLVRQADGTSGKSIKVKFSPLRDDNGANVPDPYGEVFTTVLSSRLLRALGFGTNDLYLVKTLRCYGCSKDPWSDSIWLYGPNSTPLSRYVFKSQHSNYKESGRDDDGNIEYVLDTSQYTEFTYVSIQKKVGFEIQSFEGQGIGYDEFSNVNPANHAALDAFRLLSVFLNHADNKASNQALTCMDTTEDILEELKNISSPSDSYSCKNPIIIIKDAGKEFGSGAYGLLTQYRALDLDDPNEGGGGWKQAKIWQNDDNCMVDIHGSPFNSSFHPVVISEEGRQLLAHRLNQLTSQQIGDLFKGVKVSELPFSGHPEFKDVQNWVKVFMEKRDEINSRTCPISN